LIRKKILGEQRKEMGRRTKWEKNGDSFGEEWSKVLGDDRKEKGRRKMACLTWFIHGQVTEDLSGCPAGAALKSNEK